MHRRRLLAIILTLGVALLPVPLRATAPVVTPIADITEQHKGQFFTVQGEVTSARAFRSGMRYTVRDDSGPITLAL